MEAATLSISHDTVQVSAASYRNATLLGDQPPDASDPDPATRLLPPGQTDRVDLDRATKGAAAESGFSLEATGHIVPFCYPAVLSPYRVVMVKISDSQYSTKYVISQVTHTLTRSIYTQSFAMKSNAVTGGGGAGGLGFNIPASIF